MAIAELPHAVLHEVAVNEIAFDQKHNPDGTPTLDDPIKLRFGAFRPPDGRGKFYIGCIGFDVLRWKDGQVHRTEVGFIKLAIDETRDGDGKPMPMIEFFLTKGIDDSTDAANDRVSTFSRSACIARVPLFPDAGINAPVTAAPQSFMSSPDGRYQTHMQGDGNFVTYDTAVTPWKPLWSAWHGKIA